MEFKEISSRDNPLVKLVSALQNNRKSRAENGLFVLEGLRICKDATENNISFEKLIVSKSAKEKYFEDIQNFIDISKECYLFSDDLFKKISDTTSPQGIIALVKTVDLKAEFNKSGRYIALENLNDPSNLGAVSRTAEALGVSGIILSSDSCDPYSPKALRASMGTLLRMPVIILENFSDSLFDLGLRTYSCVVDGDAEKITDIKFSDSSVLIIGNEATGISDKVKAKSDYRITIPMSGTAESLNAAVAASISMWEMMK